MAQKTYVEMSDPQYERILQGIRTSYQHACICWIDQLNNPTLEQHYQQQRHHIHTTRGSVQEMSLYHGTSKESADIIIDEGFDPLVNKNSAYGKGTYFAKQASYSKNYAPPSINDDISFMLICDVLVGTVNLYGSGEPIDTQLDDNSVDHLQYPSIYVTPYRYGAIPRYLVAFYRNAKV